MLPLRMQRIKNAIFWLGGFSDNEQAHLRRGVVEHAVGNAGAGRKADAITGAKPVQMPVEPDIWCAFDHIDEFFLGAFGVRERCATARQQAVMMNAEPLEAEMLGELRANAHEFDIAGITVVVGLFDLGLVGDASGAVGHNNVPHS